MQEAQVHRFDPWVGKIPWRREWYSCLKNSMDIRAWRATVHGIAKNWTQLSDPMDFILCLKKGSGDFLADTPDVLICFVSQSFKAHRFSSNTGIIYFVIINPVVLKAQHSKIAHRWNDQAKKLIREKIKFHTYISK